MDYWTFIVYCQSGNIAEIQNAGLSALEVIEPEQRQEGFDIACMEGHEQVVVYIAKNFGNINLDNGMRLATKNAKVNVVTALLMIAASRNPNLGKNQNNYKE